MKPDWLSNGFCLVRYERRAFMDLYKTCGMRDLSSCHILTNRCDEPWSPEKGSSFCIDFRWIGKKYCAQSPWPNVNQLD